MNEKLKPCPFCGNAKLEAYNDGCGSLDDSLSISCGCGLTFNASNCFYPAHHGLSLDEHAKIFLEIFVKAWNTRADGWVSIKDRMPEHEIYEVLEVIVFNGEDVFPCGYTKADGFFKWCQGYEDRNEYYKDVTHWHELPESPRIKGQP